VKSAFAGSKAAAQPDSEAQPLLTAYRLLGSLAFAQSTLVFFRLSYHKQLSSSCEEQRVTIRTGTPGNFQQRFASAAAAISQSVAHCQVRPLPAHA
jgi:hypothetical protein